MDEAERIREVRYPVSDQLRRERFRQANHAMTEWHRDFIRAIEALPRCPQCRRTQLKPGLCPACAEVWSTVRDLI